jgi:hypothetical protein
LSGTQLEEGFGGALDLSGADTSGFAALESDTYAGELFEYKWAATKGGQNADGSQKKMPEGTPMLKLQFKIIQEGFENRRVFDQFVIPPGDYDAEKAAKMKGALVRYLVASGLEEDEVKSKKFKLNDALDNLVGEPLKITVRKKQKYNTKPEDDEWDNEVVGYKKFDAATEGAGGKLL